MSREQPQTDANLPIIVSPKVFADLQRLASGGNVEAQQWIAKVIPWGLLPINGNSRTAFVVKKQD